MLIKLKAVRLRRKSALCGAAAAIAARYLLRAEMAVRIAAAGFRYARRVTATPAALCKRNMYDSPFKARPVPK